MKELPSILKKYGTTLKLVRRSRNKAIYAQYHASTLLGYEVIKIRVRPPKRNDLLKRDEPEREVYPTTEQWGKMGWTCMTWERAMARYNSIL